MSEKMTKIENKLLSIPWFVKLGLFFHECWMEFLGIILGTTMSPISVYAQGKLDGESSSMIKSIIGAIMAIFPAIGVVIALVGAFKLFMAFRNDQPDAYSGAIKDIVIGGLLIGFKALIWDEGGANLQGKIK